MFNRPDLADLTAAQIAPLEALMEATWSDTWRELAISCYITLIAAPGSDAIPLPILAQLAVELVMGIAQDLGGTQPYIPVGAEIMSSARVRRVVDLLGRGQSYKAVADATGITAMRVRRIERAWRQEQWAQRQGQLPLAPDEPVPL